MKASESALIAVTLLAVACLAGCSDEKHPAPSEGRERPKAMNTSKSAGSDVLAEQFDEFYAKATNGDARAQNMVGLALMGKNDPKAREWLEKASSQGFVQAQCDLGYMYENGYGVPVDLAEAAKHYRIAADAGIATAQSQLGLLYAKGQGVPNDNAQALDLFEKAAKQGETQAQCALAVMYRKGQGVPKDMAISCKFSRAAADRGDKNGQYETAICYATGEGVAKDMVQALKWMTLAARQDVPLAAQYCGRMKSEMTSAQVAQAMSVVASFEPIKTESNRVATVRGTNISKVNNQPSEGAR